MTARTRQAFAARLAYQAQLRHKIAIAALRRIRRIGSNVGGVRSEESEIAQKALRRIKKNGGAS